MTTKSKWLYLSQRTASFRDLLREQKLDGYLLTHLSDVFYFTDYKSEGYYALIGLRDSWLFLPNLLFDQAKACTFGFTCLKGRFSNAFKDVVSRHRLKRVGFDPDQIPYSFGQSLEKMGLQPARGLVSRLRAIKDPLELDRLRRANHLAAQGAEFARARLRPGKTEKQLAAEIAHFFSTKGDGVAFDLIVAAGPHSAFPHHIVSEYRMRRGDPVICDIGATVAGYRSDLTRTFTLGRISPSFLRVFKVVEQAQNEGIRQVRAGVTAGSVDLAARRVIRNKGFGRAFVHSTGHGVGIDIHEHPRLGPAAKDKLRAGMVITVEPGIYLPGKFGVRIEDTLLVTQTGSEILTQ